jgi:HEAT repeat protein
MTAQGYVKYKGRYILPQELELLEQENAQNEQEKAWFKRVYVLHSWLHGSYDNKRVDALRELEKIEDADAVPALARSFRNDSSESYRIVYVRLLGRLQSIKATEALAWQSLQDDSASVRQEALAGVGNGDRTAALGYYVRSLRDKSNPIVLRSAMALGEYGDAHVIPNLIDALVTEHMHIITVPQVVASGLSFNADGSVGGSGTNLPPQIEGMLRSGQATMQDPNINVRMQQIQVKKLYENQEVLAALKKLSGEDFGYDEKTWRLWWNQHKVDLGNKVKNS